MSDSSVGPNSALPPPDSDSQSDSGDGSSQPNHLGGAGRNWTSQELAELINRHEKHLLAYARRMLGGDWQGAQDVVQETFLRLCREDPDKIASRAQPWLFAVCRSRVIDMQRTRHSHPVDAAQIAVVDPQPDAPSAAIAAEQSDQDRCKLASLVGRLTDRQQEILRLRMQAGLSYREIADVTGLTVSNVGFHLHSAVRSLKDSIGTSAT